MYIHGSFFFCVCPFHSCILPMQGQIIPQDDLCNDKGRDGVVVVCLGWGGFF